MSQEMSRDAWKYTTGPKPEDLKGNRYLNPPKTEPTSQPTDSSSLKTHLYSLEIGPLTCYDSNGKPFEHYDRVEIARDVARETGVNAYNPNIYGTLKAFTLPEAILHFEQEQMFLPSFALTCAALVWLFEHKDNPAAIDIINQYKDTGFGFGILMQNTLIHPTEKILVHYPSEILKLKLNLTKPSKYLPFPIGVGFNEIQLLEALMISDFKASLQNLTGLPDPGILNEIGKQLGSDVYFNPPKNEHHNVPVIYAGLNLILHTNRDINDPGAARGFRLVGGGSK